MEARVLLHKLVSKSEKLLDAGATQPVMPLEFPVILSSIGGCLRSVNPELRIGSDALLQSPLVIESLLNQEGGDLGPSPTEESALREVREVSRELRKELLAFSLKHKRVVDRVGADKTKILGVASDVYDLLVGRRSPYEGSVSEVECARRKRNIAQLFQLRQLKNGISFVIPQGASQTFCSAMLFSEAWNMGDSRPYLSFDVRRWLMERPVQYAPGSGLVFLGSVDAREVRWDRIDKIRRLEEIGLQPPSRELFTLGYLLARIVLSRDITGGHLITLNENSSAKKGGAGLEFVYGIRADFKSASIGMRCQ